MRRLFYVLAGVFVAWIAVATALWLRQAGGAWPAWHHFWSAVGADWMLVLVLSDLSVFTLLALVWLVRDLRARGAGVGRIVAWLAPVLVVGSAVLLVYLGRHHTRRAPA
jgi:hypothetical protein